MHYVAVADPFANGIFNPLTYRLTRIMKLGKAKPLVHLLMDYWNISPKSGKTVRVMVMLCMWLHVISCSWWFWKTLSLHPDDNLDGFLDAQPWGMIERHPLVTGHGKLEAYVISMYLTTMTLTTVGYGDISASTDLEKLTSLLCEFGGVIFFGAIVGTLSSLITREKASKMRYLEKMESTREFMQLKELDRSTQRKIRPPRSGPFKRPSIFHRKIACLVVLHGHDGGHLTKISGGFLAGQWRSTSTNFGRRLSSPSARS